MMRAYDGTAKNARFFAFPCQTISPRRLALAAAGPSCSADSCKHRLRFVAHPMMSTRSSTAIWDCAIVSTRRYGAVILTDGRYGGGVEVRRKSDCDPGFRKLLNRAFPRH